MTTPLISLQGVSKSYGELQALAPLDLELSPGEVLGLFGNNGSGKSTLLKILSGSFKASSGSYTFQEQLFWRDAIASKNQTGYQPEEVEIPALLTLSEYVAFVQNVKASSDSAAQKKEGLDELFWIFQIENQKNTLFQAASLGMRKKMALAAAFVSNPKFIILDEPTNGLDLKAQETLLALIQKRKEAGTGFVIATHNFEWAERVIDHALALEKGRVLDRFSLKERKNQDGNLRGQFMSLLS